MARLLFRRKYITSIDLPVVNGAKAFSDSIAWKHLSDGLKSLGDLLALSRSALSRRFDAELMNRIAQLNNEKPFTAPRFQPGDSFHDLVQNPQGIFNN